MEDDEEGPPRLPGGKFYMTPEGHERLQTELAARRTERHRVVEIVAWAAGNGDRSENADYKEGKRRLREIDRRLRFIARRLAHAEVVDPSAQTGRDRVFFGATVTYLTERDERVAVTIVGVDEASMAESKISIGSPVALALLGARGRRGAREDAAWAGADRGRRHLLSGAASRRLMRIRERATPLSAEMPLCAISHAAVQELGLG